MSVRFAEVTVITEHTVRVEWEPGYAFGDSFQHAQGKFAAARCLGLKATTKAIKVIDAEVVDGRVVSTTWSR